MKLLEARGAALVAVLALFVVLCGVSTSVWHGDAKVSDVEAA